MSISAHYYPSPYAWRWIEFLVCFMGASYS